MSDYSTLCIHFMMLGISLAAPVGPIKLEMLKRGLSGGFWPSWLVGLGAVSADFLFMSSIFLGLSPFLQEAMVQIIMLFVGIFMLAYLGISTVKGALLNRKLLQLEADPTLKTPYLTGFSLALLNPFNFVFWFGVYGGALQSIPSHFGIFAAAFLSMFILLGIVLWNVNIAFTVHFFRKLINETLIRWMTIFAGIALIGFAINLVWKLPGIL